MKIISETNVNGTAMQVVSYQNLTIEMLKPANAPRNGEFLPAKVSEGNVVHWTFQWDHPDYRKQGGIAVLRELPGKQGEYAIVLARLKAGFLDGVLPLLDLPHLQRTPTGELFGGTKLSEVVSYKASMALELGLDPNWSEREKKLMRANSALASALAAEVQAKREADALARRARRREMQKKLLDRGEIAGFTASGRERSGTPVVGEEWKTLPLNKHAIAVTAYNEETGEVGELIEAFRVVQNGSRKDRDRVAPVFATPPGQKRAQMVQVEMVIMTIKSKKGTSVDEVILVANKDAAQAHRKDGLNSGTLVAYPSGTPEEFQVVAVASEGITTIGIGTIVN